MVSELVLDVPLGHHGRLLLEFDGVSINGKHANPTPHRSASYYLEENELQGEGHKSEGKFQVF